MRRGKRLNIDEEEEDEEGDEDSDEVEAGEESRAQDKTDCN